MLPRAARSACRPLQGPEKGTLVTVPLLLTKNLKGHVWTQPPTVSTRTRLPER
jgi:hypothetical protein